jgi:hypothetical protein
MLDALPRHVGDVQQAVDATEVHERAVVREVLDDAADHGPFLQLLEQFAALGAVLLLDDGAARDHDVVSLLVELDDLELERLALEVARVAHRAHVHERARQEGAHEIDLDGEAALDPAVDQARDDLALLERGLEAFPGAGPLRLLARQARLARAVLDAVEGHFHVVADADLDFPTFVLELLRRDHGLGLEAGAHQNDVGTDFDHPTGEDLSRPNTLTRQALFEKLRKTLGHSTIQGRWPVAPRASRPRRVDATAPASCRAT